MYLNFTMWDFNITPYENMVKNIIVQNSYYAKKSKKFKETFKYEKIDDNLGEVDIANWLHKEFGNGKPMCLWDKLMREIGVIGTQIAHEVDRFARDISAEFDRTNKKIKAEVERVVDDIKEAGRKIEKEVSRTFKKIFGGGCFITTATLVHLDVYDDNCYELALIRKIRDEWLVNQPRGKEIIEIYYKLAPKIVKAIGDDIFVYNVIWDRYIEPFFVCLENKEYDEALKIYLTMVSVLKAFYGI